MEEIIIKVKINNILDNTSKVNQLINGFVNNLKEIGVEILEYSHIDLKLRGKDEKEIQET